MNSTSNSNLTLTTSRIASASSIKRRRLMTLFGFSKTARPSLPTPDTTAWSEFAKNVSGEWDGCGADFSIEGIPFELPKNVVPEAYREWEIKAFDWQTQCSTLAQPDDLAVNFKLIKFLPTVGCEPDAATRHSVDERNVGGENCNVSAFAYQSTGCFLAVWPKENRGANNGILELEHCLVDPQKKESRISVIQNVRLENSKLILKSIQVFAEQWYGQFRNGEQLGGCAIRDSTFAATEALKVVEVSGSWQTVNSIARFQHTKTVGWLLDQGSAITSKCIFLIDAEFKEIATARETLVTSQ